MKELYSIWNWEKGRYDYYRANSARPYRSRVGYPAPRGIKGLGEVPEESVHPLPAGAEYVGSGDTLVGTMASPTKRSALLFIAVAAIGLWILR